MKFKADDFKRYPAMERQDLNQSQLGSFKFTPVDPEPQRLRQDYMKPAWGAQQIQSVANEFLRSSAGRIQRAGNEYVNTRHSQGPSFSHAPRQSGDHRFFDHIKQDLSDSRLRLGAAAIRKAVDSASVSPERSPIDTGYREEIGFDQDPLTNMNPTAFDFLPASSVSTNDPNPRPSSHVMEETLLRALASEQESHEITSYNLQSEVEKRAELEREIETLQADKKSKQATIHAQKAIITKLQEDVKYLTTKAEFSAAGREPSAVNNFEDKGTAAEAVSRGEQPICYDVLERQRQNYEHQSVKKPESLNEDNIVYIPPQNTETVECTNITAEMLDELVRMQESRRGSTTASPAADSHESVLQDNANRPDAQRVLAKAAEIEKSTLTVVPKLQITETPILEPPTELLAKYAKMLASSNAQILPVPYCPIINWKVHTYDDILGEDVDWSAETMRSQGNTGGLNFHKWPVRYLPDQTDNNIFRTIMIDGLPLDTTYKDILPKIRGGSLESVQLFGPIGGATDFMTARLVFNYEGSANHVYLRYSKADPLIIRGQAVRVWMPDSPTYPKNNQLNIDFFKHCYTRLLVIENACDETFDLLPEKLSQRIQMKSIIEIAAPEPMMRAIEFISIAEATKVFRLLLTDRDFGGAVFDFEDDPCAEPYEDGI